MYLATAIAIQFLLATACYPFLVSHRGAVRAVGAAIAALVAFSPCVIPAAKPFPRFLAAASAVIVAVKLLDVRHDRKRGAAPGWRDFLAFLANPFVHVRRWLPSEPRPSRRADLLRLSASLVGLALSGAAFRWLLDFQWTGYSFALEHAAKVVAFMSIVFSLLAAAAALWRLLGGTARDYMDAPLAARTPADFWRRYNRNMQQFFYEDVFKPAGGLRAPIRTTMLVFVLSAAMHEYIFSIAVGRVQFYQTAFFLLQGVAVAATARVKATGKRAVFWIAATLAFNLASGVLFFASINGIMPFYSRGLPSWLDGW